MGKYKPSADQLENWADGAAAAVRGKWIDGFTGMGIGLITVYVNKAEVVAVKAGCISDEPQLTLVSYQGGAWIDLWHGQARASAQKMIVALGARYFMTYERPWRPQFGQWRKLDSGSV